MLLWEIRTGPNIGKILLNGSPEDLADTLRMHFSVFLTIQSFTAWNANTITVFSSLLLKVEVTGWLPKRRNLSKCLFSSANTTTIIFCIVLLSFSLHPRDSIKQKYCGSVYSWIYWHLKMKIFHVSLVVSTSMSILSADFLHAMMADHAEDFQIYVLEWP